MIQANKGNVLANFHKESLGIRWKELEYFTMVFEKMSTVSGMLASFASSALMLSVPRWESPFMVCLFLIFTGGALGFHLLVILISTLCCLWGPGKALRGDDSSHVHDTINILEESQQTAMRFFVLGLLCYFVSSILVAWLFFDRIAAIITTGLLVSFLWLIGIQSVDVRRAYITSRPLVSGKLRGNPMVEISRVNKTTTF